MGNLERTLKKRTKFYKYYNYDKFGKNRSR